MALKKINYVNFKTAIPAENLNDMQDAIIELEEKTEPLFLAEEQNRHANYFNITEDGELSLKAEYRGASSNADYADSISDMGVGKAGSLNSELPSDLVIPEIVDEVIVDRLAIGMFLENRAIESLTFPMTIDTIPEELCNMAVNLRHIKNTEHIKKIGAKAFRYCRIEKAVFPSLEEFGGTLAFSTNPHLVYADIGKVANIPDKTFKFNGSLSKVKSECNVLTVGAEAFQYSFKLANADFIKNLTSIGKAGFLQSAIGYDFDSLTGCNFGNYATHRQANPTDFWSGVKYTACNNPLPTVLCQRDERWADRVITTTASGTTLKYDNSGCSTMCCMHVYCGINNLTLTSVVEFENIVNDINPTLWSSQTGQFSTMTAFLNGLGLTATRYSSWSVEALTVMYEALKNGGYAIAAIGAPTGHGMVIYGVTDKGELLVADSEQRYGYDASKPIFYKLPFHKLVVNSEDVIVVTS